MIKKREHNKLIRDKIPEVLLKLKIKACTKILNDGDYEKSLNEKLKEEVQEFLEAKDQENWVEELADVLEVIYALLKSRKVSLQELESIRKTKKEKRGGFEKKLFLHYTEEKEDEI